MQSSNQRKASEAFETAKRITFDVQNSRNPTDMQLACDAWTRAERLATNPLDKETAHFHARRFRILTSIDTIPWAYMRGVLAGEAMWRTFGPSHLSGTIGPDEIQQASEALAIVPKAQRAYVGDTIPPAPLKDMKLIVAYWKGYAKGLENPPE